MTDKQLPERKRIRLPEFSYSENRMYFVTICVKDKENLLGRVVGYGACDVPHTELFRAGRITEKYIHFMDNRYNNVFIDNYVIMPNHIHLLIAVSTDDTDLYEDNIRVSYFGTSQAPYPTENSPHKLTLTGNPDKANEILPKFISLFKRYCNREIGRNIWQRRYYDHVLRNYSDYRDIRMYIDHNPALWQEDKYY